MISIYTTDKELFEIFKNRFMEERFKELRQLIRDKDNDHIFENIYKIFKESAILCGQEYFGCSEHTNFNEFFKNKEMIITDLIPDPFHYYYNQYIIEKKGEKIKYYKYYGDDGYSDCTDDLAEFSIDESMLRWNEWFMEHDELLKSIKNEFEKKKLVFRERIKYINYFKEFLYKQHFRFVTIVFDIDDFVLDDKKFLECKENLDQILKKNWAVIGFYKLPKELYWFNRDKETISYFVHDRAIKIYEDRFETNFKISYKYKFKDKVIIFDRFNDYNFIVNYVKDHYNSDNIRILPMKEIGFKYNKKFDFYRIFPIRYYQRFHFTDLPVRSHQNPNNYKFTLFDDFGEKIECIVLKLGRKTEKSQWVYIKDISEIFPFFEKYKKNY